MELGLQGKVALVAASSRGLGRAVAEELAAEGADIALCARSEDDLIETARAIEGGCGVRVLAVPTDLTDQEAIGHLAERTRDELGRIDILVNNAGGPPAGLFESHTLDDWRQAIRLNLESALELTRAVLPGMREAGWGRIINITSVSVKQPVEQLILSNSVRAAVTGFARTLANEVAADGITVNNALPGFTRTGRLQELAASLAEGKGIEVQEVEAGWEQAIPMKRLGEPREFAALVAFLASERASYITGCSITVDGGRVQSLL
jgi:3-oxoacyl-[acyl-carrier protein] reductase